MKNINVEITGIAPLLQHRFAEEEHGANKSRKKTKVYDPKIEAEKALYRDVEGKIYEPSEHLYQAMVRASVDFKFEGKKSFKDVISSGILVQPDQIPLGSDGYEIDTRAAVIQRSRIIRWRPRFNKWKLNFQINILDDENIPVHVVKEILDRAGERGIGDYRPRFGRFMVTAFKEQ